MQSRAAGFRTHVHNLAGRSSPNCGKKEACPPGVSGKSWNAACSQST